MTEFRINDIVEYTADNNLWLGSRHRVINKRSRDDDTPEIKVKSIDERNLATGLWLPERYFKVVEAAMPLARTPEPKPPHREQAEKLLAEAESRYATSTSSIPATQVVTLGILHALLANDEEVKTDEEVTRTDGSTVSARDLLRQIEELQERDRQRLAVLSEKERVIASLEGELNTANEARTELRRQLDSSRIGNRELSSRIDELRGEVARLNREQGIAATRKEAIAKPEGYSSDDNGATITDMDGDEAFFEWVGESDREDGDVSLRPVNPDGVWFKLAQLEALTAEIRERHRD